jgi:hypothetical protein
MGNGEDRVRRRRTEWQAILEAQERSGESAAGFCRGQGIGYKQFLYRRRTIRPRSEGRHELALSRRAVSRARSGAFLPIQPVESGGIRLRFPMGLILESDRIPPPGWVVEIAAEWAAREATRC